MINHLIKIIDSLMELAARLFVWAYCGVCLLLWDSSSVWCWIFSEAFLLALAIFIWMPIYAILKMVNNTTCKAEINS